MWRKPDGGLVHYSQWDGEVSTLIFCSCEWDGDEGLNHLHLIDKLDPELVMKDCRKQENRLKIISVYIYFWPKIFPLMFNLFEKKK